MRYRLLTAALALAGLALVSGCGREPEAKPELVRPVRAIKLGDAQQLKGRVFPGVAKATQEVNLSFRIAGTLLTRPINIGDEIETGDVLARLDPRDFDVNLRRAQAELENAKSTATRTATEFTTAEEVYAKGALTDMELARYRDSQDSAKAQVWALEAAVETAEDTLADTSLAAPFDGVITAIFVENFEDVQAKENICRLLDDSRIEVQVDVHASVVATAHRAEKLELWCTFNDFPGLEVPAEIKELGTEASAVTRTFPITLIMDQPEGIRILPGMAAEVSGRATMPGELAELGLEVPSSAVFEGDDGGRFVWTIDEASGKVTRRPIEIERITAIGFQIKGIESGQWVATAGVHYLQDGQTVRIVNAG